MITTTLNKKITIETIDQVADEFGAITDVWLPFFTAFASITPINGKETFLSSQEYSTVSHKIRTRFKDGVNPSMRIVYQDRIFNIARVFNVREANKELDILAIEVV